MSELPYDKLAKYLKGNLTVSERAEVEAWIQADPANEEIFASLKQVWDHSDARVETEETATDAQWKTLEAQLLAETRYATRVRSLKRTLTSQPMRRVYGIAASLALIIISYLVLFPADQMQKIRDRGQPRVVEAPVEDIQVVAGAEVKQVALPDQSQVWLDAGSTLTYTTAFNTTDRTVRLTGRAFFDVQRDETKAFIIHARNTRVEVLGTSFSVSAIPDQETVEVTVVTGEVAFEAADDAASRISLVAEEKAVYHTEELTLNKQMNDNPNFLAWRQPTEEPGSQRSPKEAVTEDESVPKETQRSPREAQSSPKEVTIVAAEDPEAEVPTFDEDIMSLDERIAYKEAIRMTVRHEYRWKKNFFNQTVVRGLITNNSDSLVYKRVIFKIWCQNRTTGKEYIQRFPIDAPLEPGETLSYKKTFLMDWMSNTNHVEIEVESVFTLQ